MTDQPSQPAPLKFAYWVPNVSGGLVTSTIEQRTDWSYDYNRELAVLAENNGFDYALTQVRYIASYGADHQHESTSFSLALALATERLRVIAAVHPGLWHPGVLAKWVATADHLTHGRIAINVVSGWLKNEFLALGELWLEHDERYRRTEEFIRYLRAAWEAAHATSSATSTGCTATTSNPNRWTCPAGDCLRSSSAATPRPPAEPLAATPTGTSPTAPTSKDSPNR